MVWFWQVGVTGEGKEMKATVCQLDNRPDAFQRGWRALAAHVRQHGSDFVLLPEMPFFRWLPADPTPSGRQWLESVAAHESMLARMSELGAPAAMTTRPVQSGSRRLNRAVLWTSENGCVGVHDKWHLPDEEGFWEATWYDRGDPDFALAHFGDVRIGVQICTEMWFFEHARSYARRNAHILCVPRATPHGTTAKWLAGGQAAAVVSGAYCLSSNLHTPQGAGGGLSWIIDPDGTILAITTPAAPFATVTVDLELARRAKSTYPRYCPD